MAEKKVKWNPTCNRYVAFIDIMGTKDRLQRYGHKEALKKHKSIIRLKEILELFPQKPIQDEKIPPIKTVVFSDSIMLISDDISESNLLWMLIETQLIMYLAIDNGIPIKGAIACGIQTADFKESLHFGQPLIDAYELQEELKLYGVVLHHTIEEALRKFTNIDSYFVVQVPVPMKSGKITHYLVDWTKITESKSEDPQDLVSKLYSGVSGTPRIYIDNTLKFISEIQKSKKNSK